MTLFKLESALSSKNTDLLIDSNKGKWKSWLGYQVSFKYGPQECQNSAQWIETPKSTNSSIQNSNIIVIY